MTDLPAVAQRILDAVAAAYTDPGYTGKPLPERRYRHASRPADDCEQLVVFWTGLTSRTDGDGRCATVRTAEFRVQLLRCVPGMADDGTAPPASRLDVSSATLIADGYLIHAAVEGARQTIAPRRGGIVLVGPTEPREPADLGGVECRVLVEV